MAILSGCWTSWWPSQMHVTGVYFFFTMQSSHFSWFFFLSHIQWKLLLDKIYFMPFSVNCTDRPCVYKINSSIQANKNISSTLCLSMERNWACPLQFYYRSSEGQPLDSSDPCRLPKGQRTRPVWSSTCCEPITWILSLQIFARLWIV